jgi:iron-sulfur cluster repair protein YtfE (RIC family)
MAANKPNGKATKEAADALTLLMQDHENVRAMFRKYDRLTEASARAEERDALAALICAELTIHTQIEEEIFYPAIRRALKDKDLIDEALVEHSSAKELISQLADMDAKDELFDAKVKVLGEQIDHHVEEEESEMFPQIRKSDVDLEGLGAALFVRKQELLEQLDIPAAS